jgi:tRNA wybutosine-synthesizing protein 1
MPTNHKNLLYKQQNRLVGEHSAVKICTWTKNSLRGDDSCYKQKFYGIESHRCVQMSPSVGYCQHRCVFCWRPIEHTIASSMKAVDEPDKIIEGCLAEQKRLLAGFGGNKLTDEKKLKEAYNPRHFAISLTGEPTLYPKLSELIKKLHARGFTTFVVTNGLQPVVLAKLEPPTQLYVSVDAPNKDLYQKIDRPEVRGGWESLEKTLKLMPLLGKKTRTCLRFTMIRHLNMENPQEWADIINMSQPMFVELKAYMHVGFSRHRLKKENMPLHAEVADFAKKISEHTEYRIVDEHVRSRAVLMLNPDNKLSQKLSK